MTELTRLLHQHPGGVTVAEVAAQLAVTRRSARRYLCELRRDLESIAEQDGQRRWRIPAIDLPRRLSLRRTQAYALLAARPLFEPMRGSAVHQELELAAEDLLGVARRPGRGPNAGVSDAELERRFRYVPFGPIDYAARSAELDDLFHAVADLRPLACLYPGVDGTLRRRVLHPYALVLYKEAIFTVARDTEAPEICVLELEHVRQTRVFASERFELPPGFSLDDYAQGQFGLWRATAPLERVIIDFDARVASALRARRFHRSQELQPLECGGVRMQLALGDLAEVAPWVLGFGALATVLEPEALRSTVRASLAAALMRYESVPSTLERRLPALKPRLPAPKRAPVTKSKPATKAQATKRAPELKATKPKPTPQTQATKPKPTPQTQATKRRAVTK